MTTRSPLGLWRPLLVALAASLATALLAGAPAAAQSTTGTTGLQPLLANPCPKLDPTLAPGGGPANIVVLENPSSADLQVRGSVQVGHSPGQTASPTNCAAAMNGSSGPLDPAHPPAVACVGCRSFAVALQIDLISRTASTVAPRNIAKAQNVRCQSCLATAIALQSVIQVDDPTRVPPDVNALANDLNAELRQLQIARGLTPQAAAGRILAVVSRYQQIAQTLSIQRNDATDPTPTP